METTSVCVFARMGWRLRECDQLLYWQIGLEAI